MPWGIVGFYTTSTGALDCQREEVFMLGVGNAGSGMTETKRLKMALTKKAMLAKLLMFNFGS